MAQDRIANSVLAAALILSMACSGPIEVTTSRPTADATTTTASTSTAITNTVSPTTTAAGTVAPLVLVFSETAGFRHDSISAGIAAIRELGDARDFDVTASEDSSVFGGTELSNYDVIVFLSTTGDVLTTSEEAAFEEFVRSGGGFVGIHSASDTEYDWAWYGGLVGTYFADHPAVQAATVRSTESGHPASRGLPVSFVRIDEWYNFRSAPGPGVVVLAVLDETTYEGGTMGADHPIAWAQEYDGGRSFYTGGGHTIESYSEPLFRDHIAMGILWAAGSGSDS
jgi:type 1 glutamine amidotransferase